LLRELCFRFGKWDLHVGGQCRVLPVSVVLSRAEHEQIVHLAEQFASMLRRVERRDASDLLTLEHLGIDPRLARWIDAEGPREAPAFGRGDFFLTPDGRWVLSEFNEDVPGGFNEAYGLTQLLDATTLGGSAVGDLRRAIVDAFAGCDGVAMLYATAFSEDLQHCVIIERWLREAGHPIAMGSPEALRCRWGRARVHDVPVEGAFRFYPGEWMADLPNAADWLRALPKLAMMNPLQRLITQSKKSFACFNADGWPEATERSLIEAHLPETRHFNPADVEAYRVEREQWVLKAAFGRMGDAVLLGALSTVKEWADAIAHAVRTPARYAMQRRFDVLPLDHDGKRLYPTVGAYVVNGRFAGYYSRAAEIPMITHEAFHVATVVADA
jgi:glutathionylspermidine synthase